MTLAAGGRALRLWMVDRRDEGGARCLGHRELHRRLERGPMQGCRLGYAIDHRRQGEGLMFERSRARSSISSGPCGCIASRPGQPARERRSARLLRPAGIFAVRYSRDYLYIGGRVARPRPQRADQSRADHAVAHVDDDGRRPTTTTTTTTTRVLLIDDQRLVASAVRRLLAVDASIELEHCQDPNVALAKGAGVPRPPW